MTQKDVPFSKEAEVAVLGAILLDESGYEQAAALLKPSDFLLDSHRKLFLRFGLMRSAGLLIDQVVLFDELQRNDELEQIGGAGYLASLTDGLPRLQNITHYCQTVADYSVKRRMLAGAELFSNQCRNGKKPKQLVDIGQKWLEKLSAHIGKGFEQKETLFETPAALSDSEEPLLSIAYPGIYASSCIGLTGKPKAAGKTTLVLSMCRAIVTGSEFLGRRTTQGPVIYLTEEKHASFRVALDRAGLSTAENFHFLPRNKVASIEWPTVVEMASEMAADVKARMIIVDTIAQWAG
jgi:replicative DNA helicase